MSMTRYFQGMIAGTMAATRQACFFFSALVLNSDISQLWPKL